MSLKSVCSEGDPPTRCAGGGCPREYRASAPNALGEDVDDSGVGEHDSDTSTFRRASTIKTGDDEHDNHSPSSNPPSPLRLQKGGGSGTSARLQLRVSQKGGVPKLVDGDQRSRFWVFEDIVAGAWFEPCFAGLILLNTFVMAAEMQYRGMDTGKTIRYPRQTESAADTWPAAESIFLGCEWVFGSLFLLELLIKFLAMRQSFFREVWNWLDFIIVAFWCLGAMKNSLLPLDPTLLQLVRLVRLLRLLRLVKALQGFESLYLMTASIKASMMALLWSAILLVLLQICIALILNQLLLGFIEDDANPLDKRERVYRYFGTFSKATLTMFEFMLANWPPSSRVLTEDVSEFYLLFVLSYQCIISFAVVKVIMGVFLQVTFNVAATDDIIMLNQKERSVRTHTKKMARLFEAADRDGNGVLDRDEFRDMVDDPVVRQWLSSMDCDVSLFAKDTDVLFSLVDGDGDGLTAEDLVKAVAHMQGPARSIDVALLADENRQIEEIVKQLSTEADFMTQNTMNPKTPWGETVAKSSLGSTGIRRQASAASMRRQGSAFSMSRSCSSSFWSFGEDDRKGSKRFAEALSGARSSSKMDATTSRRKTVGATMFRGSTVANLSRLGNTRRLPEWFDKFVLSSSFEMLFGFFIMLSTLVLAFEVQYMGIEAGYRLGYDDCHRSAEEAWPGAEDAFKVMDWLFVVVFALEVMLKLLVMNCSFFADPWHWGDIFLVVVGAVEAIFIGLVPFDAGLMRIARMVRLLRALRVVRTSSWFDSVYLMTTSIWGSLQALMWFSVLMFVVQMCIAILVNMALESYMIDGSVPKPERHLIYKYFGTFSKAILTMFEITLANWIPVCRALAENVSEWYVIFALVHKFIIGFAVVMVITGVFLQETFKVAATDDTIMITQKQRQMATHTKKMDLLFKAADEDGNGVLDRDEFKAMVDDPNVVTWLSSMGLDVTDADDLFTMVNRESEGDNEITAKDLVRGVARLKGYAKSIDLAVVLHSNTHLLKQAKALQAKVTELKELRKAEFKKTNPAKKVNRAQNIERAVGKIVEKAITIS